MKYYTTIANNVNGKVRESPGCDNRLAIEKREESG